MKEYIESIIKTGLENGISIEQLLANPDAAAQAYLDSQLKAIKEAGEKIKS